MGVDLASELGNNVVVSLNYSRSDTAIYTKIKE